MFFRKPVLSIDTVASVLAQDLNHVYQRASESNDYHSGFVFAGFEIKISYQIPFILHEIVRALPIPCS
jgi:hypothetical protein